MATISTAVKTDKATAVGDAFNGGSANLQIRTGSAPGANVAATGTMLCEITLPSTAFTSPAVAGVLSKAGTWSGTAVATGTAAHFRMTKGSYVVEGTVGTSGQDLNLSSTAITTDGVVTISTFTYTVS